MRKLTAVAAALLLTACGGEGGGVGGEAGVADRVTLVVPTPPGSSFDTWARAVAPVVSEALDTDVVVDNQPGASGLVALNEMTQARPDGSTLVLWQLGPLAVMSLQGVEEVRFDLADLSYIGNFSNADHMLFVGADTPIEDADDLVAAQDFAFASGEQGSLGYTSQQLFSEALGVEAEYITGYDDQAERLDAIARGDADAVIGPVHTMESIGRMDELRPVLRLAEERSEVFPDVPTALEVDGVGDAERELIETQFGMASAFYTVMGPPEMSEETLEALRDAFWTAANDEELLGELEERGWPVVPEEEYLTGDEVERLVPELVDVPEDYRALVEDMES